jgi:hypothetical protein
MKIDLSVNFMVSYVFITIIKKPGNILPGFFIYYLERLSYKFDFGNSITGNWI